jgi:hypothetical protein
MKPRQKVMFIISQGSLRQAFPDMSYFKIFSVAQHYPALGKEMVGDIPNI